MTRMKFSQSLLGVYFIGALIGIVTALNAEPPVVGPPEPLYCPCTPYAPPLACVKNGTLINCFELYSTQPSCYCDELFDRCQPDLTADVLWTEYFLRMEPVFYEAALCSEDGCAGLCYQYREFPCSNWFIA